MVVEAPRSNSVYSFEAKQRGFAKKKKKKKKFNAEIEKYRKK